MTTTRSWQIIGVIVSLMSIAWGVYSFMKKNHQREMDAVTILRQAQRIYDLSGRINEHEQTIKLYQVTEDSLVNEISETRKASLAHLKDAQMYRLEVDKLKSKLNETYTPIVADDNEHLRLFLGWAR